MALVEYSSATEAEVRKPVHEIRREIWRLAWPVMVGILTHMLFHLVDLYWIGYLGPEALAGVAAAGTFVMFLWTGTRVVNGGAVALISQAFGRNDEETLRRRTGDALVAGVLLGLVVFTIAYPSLGTAVAFYQLDSQAAHAAMSYLQVFLCAIPLWYVGEGATAYIIGVGRTRVIMFIGLACNLVNMVMDPALMFGWGGLPALGLQGAAAASLVSSVLFAMATIGWIIGNAGLSRHHVRLSIPAVKTIAAIGAPAAARDISRPLVAMFTMRCIAVFGSSVVAAYGLASRFMGLVVIYVIGLSVALTQICGKRIGEGRVASVEAVLRQGGRLGLLVHLVVASVLFTMARPLLSLFDDGGAVVSAGAPIIRIFSVMMVFPLFVRVLGAAFSGSGNTTPIMLSSVSTHWLVQAPLVYVAARHLGEPLGVWGGIFLARLAEAALLWMFYRTYAWQRALVTAEE